MRPPPTLTAAEKGIVCQRDWKGSSRPRYAMDNAEQPSPEIVCCLGRTLGDNINISQRLSRSIWRGKKKQRTDTGNYAREAVQTSDFNKLKSVRHIWSGSFKVNCESLGIKAYLSSKACQKVEEFSKYLLPQEVEVKKVPRLEVWPKRWKSSGPTEDCIGLLFFAPGLRSNEVSDELVKELIKSDSAFKASIGIVDLLIFPSTQLPEHNHFYHGKHYLWGVFYKRRKDTSEGVTVGGQEGSVRAIEQEEELQEEHVLDQQVEAQHESPVQEESFTSPPEPNATSVADPSAEEGGREQPSSDSEPATIKLVGVASARTPIAHQQQQTQEIHSEGSLVFSVPEEMVNADVVVGGQHGSVCAMEEEQLQEQHVLNQQDEVQPESPGPENCAVKLAGNHQPMVGNVPEVEEGFTSPPEPNASSLAEHSAEEGGQGQGQSSSVSEPITVELSGVTIFSTPRAHQQQTQEMPSEGSMVFPVPEDMVTADSNSAAVGAGQNPGTDQQHRRELPEAFGLNGPGGEPEPPQHDMVGPNASLELSLVQQEQVGLLVTPGVEDSSMEVDLELRLAVTPSLVQQDQQVGLAAPGVEASHMEVDLELSLAVKPSCDLQLRMLGS
ncbi:unnamed protein product [Urochloa humidicola]